MSSRGWASLRTDPKLNVVYVDDDFELITFDFVTEPSTKDAYLVPIRRAYRHRVPDQRRRVQVGRGQCLSSVAAYTVLRNELASTICKACEHNVPGQRRRVQVSGQPSSLPAPLLCRNVCQGLGMSSMCTQLLVPRASFPATCVPLHADLAPGPWRGVHAQHPEAAGGAGAGAAHQPAAGGGAWRIVP